MRGSVHDQSEADRAAFREAATQRTQAEADRRLAEAQERAAEQARQVADQHAADLLDIQNRKQVGPMTLDDWHKAGKPGPGKTIGEFIEASKK